MLLNAVPPNCLRALDVGSGEGLLARRLSQHSREVTAIDLNTPNPKPAPTPVTFIEGDILTYPFPLESFNFISLLATLHHLPLEAALIRLKTLLAPGGVLAIVGLYRPHTFSDYAWAALAKPVSFILRQCHGVTPVSAALREPSETLSTIRSACQTLLPGAALKRRFFYRYSLIWRKPPPCSL